MQFPSSFSSSISDGIGTRDSKDHFTNRRAKTYAHGLADEGDEDGEVAGADDDPIDQRQPVEPAVLAGHQIAEADGRQRDDGEVDAVQIRPPFWRPWNNKQTLIFQQSSRCCRFTTSHTEFFVGTIHRWEKNVFFLELQIVAIMMQLERTHNAR